MKCLLNVIFDMIFRYYSELERIKWRKKSPLFINELGVKFWRSELTNYALNKNLKNIIVYLVEAVDGSNGYLLTDDNIPIFEDINKEAIISQINSLVDSYIVRKKTYNKKYSYKKY